jgi:hypothetical protein
MRVDTPNPLKHEVHTTKYHANTLSIKSVSNNTHNRVVHSIHFLAIFGSFLHVWQKNCQNDPKNEMKNDVKNGYHEHPGKQK